MTNSSTTRNTPTQHTSTTQYVDDSGLTLLIVGDIGQTVHRRVLSWQHLKSVQ